MRGVDDVTITVAGSPERALISYEISTRRAAVFLTCAELGGIATLAVGLVLNPAANAPALSPLWAAEACVIAAGFWMMLMTHIYLSAKRSAVWWLRQQLTLNLD